MADQPAVRRNAPAGEFLVEHFMGHGDTRTHTERLNPLHGNSFGWVPGAQVGFQPPPLQTYNGIDTPILAQLAAAPTPVSEAGAPEESQEEELMSPEAVAEVCHAVNRAICDAAGDHSQPAWSDAPEWQRKSAVNGVAFHLENPDATADASHYAWAAEKVADGWVHGPKKDPELKQHPCLVPYEELPFEQRVKDHAFKAVVAALAPRIAG